MERYEDLLGLDMYGGDFDEIVNPRMVQDMLVTMVVGGVSAYAALQGIPKIPVPQAAAGADAAAQEKAVMNGHRLRALASVAAGTIGGRVLWNYNRDAAVAAISMLGGLGLLQLINSFLPSNLVPVVTYPLGALPDDVQLDEALLSAADTSRALAALEAANVQRSRGAFSGPTVTQETLMGPVVDQSELGDTPYNPYMA